MSASATIILQKSGRLSTLLEERFGVKGHSLDTKMRRVSGALPRDARLAGLRIAVAERKARVNGQIIEIDPYQFDDDYRLCLRRIEAIEPGAGLWQRLRNGLQSGMIGMVSVAALYVAIMGDFLFN